LYLTRSGLRMHSILSEPRFCTWNGSKLSNTEANESKISFLLFSGVINET